MMKKLMALVLALALVLTATAAFAEKLTMATNASFAPYEYADAEMTQFGGYAGIDVEVADALAKKLGYEGVLVDDMEFDSVVMSVQNGKSKIAMAGLTASAERMKQVYFTFPYATGVQVIIVKEDSPIKSVDDLYADGAYHVIGVQNATTGDLYANWYLADDGKGEVKPYPTGSEAVMDLVNGKLDCIIIDNEPAKAFVKVNAGLKILETEFAEEDYAIAVAKDDLLFLGQISAALQELIADGTVAAIVEKYIPSDVVSGEAAAE